MEVVPERHFARVVSDMTRLLGSDQAALIWLRNPHPELDGRSPLELLYARQFEVVEGLVQDLRSGSPG